uniref:BRCT domain-containing protein n=1 Tax=Meloidogyne hapla TaxID=6305 RepID=A0A1I8BHM3_MELHA
MFYVLIIGKYKSIQKRLEKLAPSEYLKIFGINLSTKHAYLLDCYIYDWDKDNEMPKWMADKGPGVLTPITNTSKNKCLTFDNFIKPEDIPKKLKPIGKHCSMSSSIFFDKFESIYCKKVEASKRKVTKRKGRELKRKVKTRKAKEFSEKAKEKSEKAKEAKSEKLKENSVKTKGYSDNVKQVSDKTKELEKETETAKETLNKANKISRKANEISKTAKQSELKTYEDIALLNPQKLKIKIPSRNADLL